MISTPTTTDVARAYLATATDTADELVRVVAFNRWLAQVRVEARSDGYDLGYDEGYDDGYAEAEGEGEHD